MPIHRASRIGRARVASAPADTTITDAASYVPPSSGDYDYNAFTPPTVGNTYVDPLFGKTVRTIVAANADPDENYTFHWANADGTLVFRNASGFKAISTTTGANVYTGIPSGLARAECRWHMTDPDKYFFFEGTALKRRNLAAGTTTTLKDFGATLANQGNSAPYWDRTNRYCVVTYSGSTKLWDSQTDTIYSGFVASFASIGGYIGITPDGNYIVTAAGGTDTPNKEHYSYAINHGAQTVNTTPVQYWGIYGDHGCFLSASDGKNYAIHGSNNDGYLYAIDITVSAAGKTAAQQEAQATRLISPTFAQDVHLSAPSQSALGDWFFLSTEDYDDDFDDASFESEWFSRRQEISATNVVTGVTRRLVHHRSRDIGADYYYQPHVSCSADGTLMVFSSNMNAASYGLYGISNPLTSL